MTGLLLKGLGFFLAAAAVSALITWVVPGKLLPAVKAVVWLLPLGLVGIEFWASHAGHEFDGRAIWRGIVSAGAQTLLLWPGALAGYYGVSTLRAGGGEWRGNTG
jgi:hypothetical protein